MDAIIEFFYQLCINKAPGVDHNSTEMYPKDCFFKSYFQLLIKFAYEDSIKHEHILESMGV